MIKTQKNQIPVLLKKIPFNISTLEEPNFMHWNCYQQLGTCHAYDERS